jgi:hypothetical protein
MRWQEEMGMKLVLWCAAMVLLVFVGSACATGFVYGVPQSVQKTDYQGLNLVFVKLDREVQISTNCSDKTGVVILHSNESAKEAFSLALTAFSSGRKFQCYAYSDQCSQINGSATTFPVCAFYPAITL